jgi:hypothetical protein
MHFEAGKTWRNCGECVVALWFFAGNKTLAPNYVEHVRVTSPNRKLQYGRLNKYRFSIQ